MLLVMLEDEIVRVLRGLSVVDQKQPLQPWVQDMSALKKRRIFLDDYQDK